MKILLLSLCLLTLFPGTLMAALVAAGQDTYVIGGEFVVRDGQTIGGNLDLAFAQLTVEAGGRIDGGVRAVSSVVTIHGNVTGTILSIESDMDINETANLRAVPRELDAFPYVILLPGMARIGTGLIR